MNMDYFKLLVEALVFLAIGVVVSVLTRVLISRWGRRRFMRKFVVTTSISALASLVLTEIWAQFSQESRLSRITIAICVILAVIATAAQSRDEREVSRFRG